MVFLGGCLSPPPVDSAAQATPCEERSDGVFFQDERGTLSDQTESFGGPMTLREAGTWFLCEGDWTVTLTTARVAVEFVGLGPDQTTLRGDDATVLAAHGGSILAVRDLTITGGHGTADEMGGGLHAESSEVHLDGVHFVGNQGRWGGGAALVESTAVLADVVFADNEAEHQGGGLSLENTELAAVGAVFDGNVAGTGAGLAAMPGSRADVDGGPLPGQRGSRGGRRTVRTRKPACALLGDGRGQPRRKRAGGRRGLRDDERQRKCPRNCGLVRGQLTRRRLHPHGGLPRAGSVDRVHVRCRRVSVTVVIGSRPRRS